MITPAKKFINNNPNIYRLQSGGQEVSQVCGVALQVPNIGLSSQKPNWGWGGEVNQQNLETSSNSLESGEKTRV